MIDVNKDKAELLTAALVSSGLLATIEQQVSKAVADGKVTIAESLEHKKVLVSQAAQTMALALEGAFNFLITKGYTIIKEEHGEDTSVAAEGRSEPEGGLEREGSSISKSSGPQSESTSEGNTERSGGDET